MHTNEVVITRTYICMHTDLSEILYLKGTNNLFTGLFNINHSYIMSLFIHDVIIHDHYLYMMSFIHDDVIIYT